jgi:diguanylate cyclase (GGDEF)-like protein
MDSGTTISVVVAGISLATTGIVLTRARRADEPMVDVPLIDEETGLGSRTAFAHALVTLDPEVPVSITLLDLDNVSEFIATMGEPAAHAAIARIAGTIRESMQDRFGTRVQTFRTAPDEFAVIMPRFDPDHAVTTVEGLRDRIADSLAASERLLSVSCGISCFPQHVPHPRKGMIGSQILGQAQRALFHAKTTGGSRTILFEPGLLDPSSTWAIQSMLYTTAKALAAAVDAKDAYTHAHSQNVADLAQYLARTMGMTEDQVTEIGLGGLLHDVGKIGVSDQTLRKPGKLTHEEWEEIKSHCEIGHTILSGIDGIDGIRQMVLYHHERPDGSGYPYGLKGDHIPLSAKIIGVADAFDSMTAERVYQKARTPEQAIAEIVKLSGTQFDERVVKALCDLMVFELGGYDAATDDENVEPDEFLRAA